MKVTFSNLEQFLTNATTASDLPVLLGVAEDGVPVCLDLAKSPHLLIAGAPYKGKTSALRLFKFRM